MARTQKGDWQIMEPCYECGQRAGASISGELLTAKKKARAWGRATGKTELIIVRLNDGTYSYRTTDSDLAGCVEVDRVLIL